MPPPYLGGSILASMCSPRVETSTSAITRLLWGEPVRRCILGSHDFAAFPLVTTSYAHAPSRGRHRGRPVGTGAPFLQLRQSAGLELEPETPHVLFHEGPPCNPSSKPYPSPGPFPAKEAWKGLEKGTPGPFASLQ